MSLVPVLGLALDLVHVHLSEMPVYSPIFYICDNTYTLSLLLHDADYYHQVHNKLVHILYSLYRRQKVGNRIWVGPLLCKY